MKKEQNVHAYNTGDNTFIVSAAGTEEKNSNKNSVKFEKSSVSSMKSLSRVASVELDVPYIKVQNVFM